MRGMGLFELTPRAGATYTLRAVEPAGVTLRCEVPSVAASGVTLRALRDITVAGEPIWVEVGSTEGGEHTVVAYCRGVQVGQASLELAAGGVHKVEITRSAGVGGVMRVTVFDAAGVPRAERLVNVEPARRLTLEVKPARKR